MKEKKVNSTEEQLQLYEQYMHEKNKKRVQWGIRVLLFGPLIFVALMMLMDSNKNIYLLLWIISLFGLSAYLISVEYMDHQMQSHLRKLGVESKLQMETPLIEIGVTEEDEEEYLEVSENEDDTLYLEHKTDDSKKKDVSFSPFKQLRDDWKAVALEEKEEEARIEEMIEQNEVEEETSVEEESVKVNFEDYDFDPFEDDEDEILVEAEVLGEADVQAVSEENEVQPKDQEVKQNHIEEPADREETPVETKAVTSNVKDSIQTIDEQIEELIRMKMEIQIRAKVEAEVRAKVEAEMEAKIQEEISKTMDRYVSKEVSKLHNTQNTTEKKEEK